VGVYLAEQTAVFFGAVLVGAAMGALYDVFRISRVAFSTPEGVIFAEDVVFFVFCALITFYYGLTVIDGSLRLFVLLGELFGGIIYRNTVGRLVMRVSKSIISAVRAIFGFITRTFLLPLWRLAARVVRFLLTPYLFVINFFKKKLQNIKYRLKNNCRVLYNHLKAGATAVRNAKKLKVSKNGKKKAEAQSKKETRA
jgi:spore cortex biosynthesis protein YabQ